MAGRPFQAGLLQGRDPATAGAAPLRVVIVGGGPRGLWALQSLLRSLDQAPPTQPVAVTVIEPHEHPGAGWVYDPDGPSALRMNLASRHIDASGGERSFLDWAADRGEPVDGESFVPRATVGRYLADCFRRTCDAAPSGVSVSVRCDRVLRCVRSADVWQLRLASGDRLPADELLLAIGHAASGPVDGAAADVSGIYPVDDRLSEERVPVGSRVALRGFALTGIDAILALTEGRGGRFVEQDGTLTYEPSGREPSCILPFSRTGQPMAVKPSQAVNERRGADLIWARLRAEIDEAPATVAVIRSLAVDAAAARYKLDRHHQRKPTGTLWQSLLGRLNSPGACDSVPADWQRSLDVAAGREPIDLDQSLGAAWRMLYPSIVNAVGFGRLPSGEVAAFREMATRFERLAFGPPAASVERVLALVRAGFVSFDQAAGPTVGRTSSGWQIGEAAADCLVDARIAPPGLTLPPDGTDDQGHGVRESLLATLASRGTIAVDPHWDAVRTEPDATAGPNLAIVGRATEGWILGHDTLQRSMHDQIPRWADRVAARSVAMASVVPPGVAAR